MERYQEVVVALSESVMKNLLKRSLAEKSRWRPIRLAIKPCYLGNKPSQIKSDYWTLLGNHGRSFRIRHKKTPEAPPSGEITMTSYPVGNETTLSRKPCIPVKSYYGTLTVNLSESIMKNCLKRPQAVKSWWRDILFVIKARNHASQIKSYYGSLSRSLGRLVIFIKKTANINSKNLAVYKCC